MFYNAFYVNQMFFYHENPDGSIFSTYKNGPVMIDDNKVMIFTTNADSTYIVNGFDESPDRFMVSDSYCTAYVSDRMIRLDSLQDQYESVILGGDRGRATLVMMLCVMEDRGLDVTEDNVRDYIGRLIGYDNAAGYKCVTLDEMKSLLNVSME